MAMPQCCYLAKGAKRPSHTTNTIKFDRIPFDPCNSIKRFDLSPFDQKISTYLQPPEINLIAINMRGERDKVCVKISSIPHCNCTFRVKKPKAVCRHIIFVLLFICNLHPTSPVIHQIAYSQNELKEILGGAPSGIEDLSADLRG